jgi:hypothetical protein
MADEHLFQRYREVLTLGIKDFQSVLQAKKNKLVNASFEIKLTLQDKASCQRSQGRQQFLSQ